MSTRHENGDGQEGRDRRGAQRFLVNWPVTISVAGTANTDLPEQGSIANLSSTGAFINLTAQLKIGAHLDLRIDVPLKKKNLMQYMAEVVRVEPSGIGSGIAVRFDTTRPVFLGKTKSAKS